MLLKFKIFVNLKNFNVLFGVDAGANVPLRECPNCGRNFAADRLQKLVAVCAKSDKKRKVFDSTKMRVQGTEAAAFVPSKKKAASVPVKPPKNNWKTKHEEFIQAIRYAKAATKIEKEGGSVALLPPPPVIPTTGAAR